MDIRLVLEMEAELGPLPQLAEKFKTGGWAVAELVTVMQMLLQDDEDTVDFMSLGNRMLVQGLGIYVARVNTFFDEALGRA